RLRSSLRDTVERAWLALGGPACVEDATGLEDAGVYLDFLEANEVAGGITDWPSFESRMAKLYAVPDLAANETLQILTVHKARGLEFDTVIVPGLGIPPRSDDSKLMLWLRRPDGRVLLAPIKSLGAETEPAYR